MSFLEKWQLAMGFEFSVSKGNCDGNKLSLGVREGCSAKRELKNSLSTINSVLVEYMVFFAI